LVLGGAEDDKSLPQCHGEINPAWKKIRTQEMSRPVKLLMIIRIIEIDLSGKCIPFWVHAIDQRVFVCSFDQIEVLNVVGTLIVLQEQLGQVL